MTSNLGTEYINDSINSITDENREEVFRRVKFKIAEMLQKKLRPEFLNRIDEIVLFKPLAAKEIRKIAELQVERLKKRLKKNNIDLELTEEAFDWLAKLGFDNQFGARPLKRALQKHIADPLAIKILSNEFGSGDKILVDCCGGSEFNFIKSK